jgi:hypothetical protein
MREANEEGVGGLNKGIPAGKKLKEVFKQKCHFVNNFLNMAHFCW